LPDDKTSLVVNQRSRFVESAAGDLSPAAGANPAGKCFTAARSRNEKIQINIDFLKKLNII
jgi:hypothetical protein